MLIPSAMLAFSFSLHPYKGFYIFHLKKMRWSMFGCGALDSALGRSQIHRIVWVWRDFRDNCSHSSGLRQQQAQPWQKWRRMSFTCRAEFVFLSSAVAKNTIIRGTSIIVRAHKKINSKNKTSEQVDLKQRNREGSCHLWIRKIPCYMQACCFQSRSQESTTAT